MKYLAEQAMSVQNLPEHMNFFGPTPPFLLYKNNLQNNKFSWFLLHQTLD